MLKNKTDIDNTRYTIVKNIDIFSMIQNRINAKHDGSTVFVPHVCNNIDLFGAGFAGQVGDKFPTVKTNYHLLGKNFLSKNMGYSQILKTKETEPYKHKLYFVNMIAQNGIKSRTNPRPLNYYGLVKSMVSISKYMENNTGLSNNSENVEIHCPRFGCGLAGGSWDFISDLIDDIWGKYKVFVYLPKNN